MVFATIWARRQNWNKHDQGPGPNDFQPDENEQVNRFMFDSGVHTRSVLSTLLFRTANEELTEQDRPADNFGGKEAEYRE